MSSTSVISADQAKTIARRACDDDDSVEVLDYHLESYSKSKVGFLGSHQKLEITVRRGDKTEKLRFFVKSVPSDSEAQMEFVKQRRVFNQEAEFFTKLMPQLLDATADGEIEAWAPKCYLANEDLIVLEDVRERGFAMSDSNKILATSELESAARAMGRMHAASMVAEKRLGKPLNELYPRACAEQIFHSQIRDHGLPLFESLIVDVAKRENRRCRDVLAMCQRAFDFVARDGGHRVVCHGDAWPNNVMINREAEKCLLVDYQVTRYAPRMFDVAMLVCLSSYRADRDRDEGSVVKAYWEELCESLGKCEPTTTTIERPTYDELLEEYEEAKHAALLMAVMYLPSIMLSEEVFAEHKDDPAALYQKFVFRRDNECVLELMDKDEEYARRINEAVLSFVDSCEKLAEE